jgi:protoporphyrinogen IX oxidase
MWMLWVKALHVLAIISWMAGMLYLPRLMVYHVETVLGSQEDERFKIMERRLLKAIMTPAAVVSLVTGLGLVFALDLLSNPLGNIWFVVKGVALVALFVVHGILAGHVKSFARGERRHGHKYYRVLNEVPTALMVIIVQPF